MIKKFVNFCMLILRSGVLFHRSTFIGVLCGLWVFFGAQDEESVFGRMLTLDLYLLMFAFLLLYRMLLLKKYKADGQPDYAKMGICLAGDFAWAVVAMFCAVPFLMTFSTSDSIASRVNNPQMRQLMFLGRM